MVQRIDALSESIRLRPAAARDLAWRLSNAGESDAALTLLQSSWATNPGNVDVAEALIGLRLDLGDASGAVAELRALAAADPLDYDSRIRLGDLLCGRQDFGPAVNAYRAARDLNPLDPTVRLRLARALTWAAIQEASAQSNVQTVAAGQPK